MVAGIQERVVSSSWVQQRLTADNAGVKSQRASRYWTEKRKVYSRG